MKRVLLSATIALSLNVAGFAATPPAPEASRPYRCLGYPVLPAIFLLVVASVIVNTFVATPQAAFFGAGLMLLGLPFYFYWSRSVPIAEPA